MDLRSRGGVEDGDWEEEAGRQIGALITLETWATGSRTLCYAGEVGAAPSLSILPDVRWPLEKRACNLGSRHRHQDSSRA